MVGVSNGSYDSAQHSTLRSDTRHFEWLNIVWVRVRVRVRVMG